MKVVQFIRVNHLFNRVAFASIAIIFLLVALLCFPNSNNEIETKAITGTAAESTITLDITNSTASVDLTVNSTSGNFAVSANDNKASFNVTTNNYTGYTLSISADDDTGTLINGEETLDSVTTNLTEEQFNTTTNNGKWGYSPSKYMNGGAVVDNTGDNPVFLSSPTTESTILDVTDSANNEANTYTIGLGARADYSTVNGTYTKTFTLTVVGNPINYSITYNANAGTDTVANMPYESTNNVQAGDTGSTSITLSDLVPTRAHYTFLGWCSGIVTTTNGIDSCASDATIYNPNGDGTNLVYGIDQTVLNNNTLTAMWKVDTFTCTKQYKLQNADGTYPDAYTADGSETINYGSTCTYSKTITDYQGDTGNDAARSTSQTVTSATTLSLDFPRNTYALTVNRNTSYISSVTGAGTYRWGQTISISASANSGDTFTSWSQTAGTTGSFGSTSSASTTFTMGKGVATIYANGRTVDYCVKNGVDNANCMQKMAAGNCTTSAKNAMDSRDGQTYKVQRLADGKCWLLDNLRLNLGNSTFLINTTASNTNASTTSINYMKNGGGSASDRYPITGLINWASDVGDSYSQALANGDSRDVTVTSFGSGSGKAGVYYNFCAVSAGSYCYGNGATSAGSPVDNASEDICPAGWRMPTAGSGGEFQKLYEAYNWDVASFRNALSVAYAGLFYGGAAHEQSNFVRFWGSTRYDNTYMYDVAVGPTYVYPDDHINRSGGNPVRCLLK